MEKALATSTHRVKIHRTEHPDGILLYRIDDSTTHTHSMYWDLYLVGRRRMSRHLPVLVAIVLGITWNGAQLFAVAAQDLRIERVFAATTVA